MVVIGPGGACCRSMTEVDDLLVIPAEDWAPAALEFVLASEPQPVAYHSIRSYFFARLLTHENTVGRVMPTAA